MLSIIVIIIFLAISFTAGLKNPLFFLIFPFSIIQGPGVFIDQSVFTFAGFGLQRDLLIIVYAIIAFILVKRPVKNEVSWIDKIFLIYIVYISLLLLFSFFIGYINWRTVSIFRIFLYIPIYFFIFKIIFSTVTKEQFIKFLHFGFIITIISSILYIINSSEIIKIFPFKAYEQVGFGSQSFSRDFLTIPIFWALYFIISLVFLQNNKFYFGNKKSHVFYFIVAIIVMLFTFTRGIFIAFVFITFLSFFLTSKMKIKNKVTNYTLIFLLLVLSIYLIVHLFSGQIVYFSKRNDLLISGGLEEGNTAYRILLYTISFQMISASKISLLFGLGFSQAIMDYFNKISLAWMGDTMWPFFIVYTGFVGVFIILFIIVGSLITAYRKYKKTGNIFHKILFLWILLIFMLSFNGAGFNDGYGIAMLPIALLFGEHNKAWGKNGD